jgi:Fe2+ transport system protein B
MKLLTIRDITKKLVKRSDQIAEIEKGADTLQKWQEGGITSELKMVSRHAQLIVMVQKQIDKILVDLLGEIPEVGKLVRQKFEDLLNQAKLVDRLDRTDPDMAFFEYARLQGLARELVDTLRRIAQNARENSSSENPMETEQKAKRILIATAVSLILIIVFELLVYKLPVTWVINHPNSYGIQGSIICLIPCLIVGFFKPTWRKWFWAGAVLAFLAVLLSLIGGPR